MKYLNSYFYSNIFQSKHARGTFYNGHKNHNSVLAPYKAQFIFQEHKDWLNEYLVRTLKNIGIIKIKYKSDRIFLVHMNDTFTVRLPTFKKCIGKILKTFQSKSQELPTFFFAGININKLDTDFLLYQNKETANIESWNKMHPLKTFVQPEILFQVSKIRNPNSL